MDRKTGVGVDASGRLWNMYGEHVASCPMQYPVGSRTKNQCQTVASMTPDYSEVDVVLLRKVMHLLGRLPDTDMAVGLGHAKLATKVVEANARLLFHLRLYFA